MGKTALGKEKENAISYSVEIRLHNEPLHIKHGEHDDRF